MDKELAAAVAGAPRIDISDVPGARALISGRQIGAPEIDRVFVGRVRYEDTTVAAELGETAVRVRIYSTTRPGGAPYPVVLFVHGGAFVAGDLDSEHHRCLFLADALDCIVVSVDYRLAPEHKYPAALDDCFRVLQWLGRADCPLAIDRNRIAVAGCSAGGALAAALSLRVRDEGGPQLAAQVLLAPVIDDRMTTHSMRRFIDTPNWDAGNNAVMWDLYLSDRTEVPAYAAPGRARDLHGLPPAYVQACELDPLRDEAIEYARRLMDADVTTELHCVAGAFHGFDASVPGAQISRQALSEQCYFLSRLL